MPELNELVPLWNEYYTKLSHEVRLSDLCPEAYEAEVAESLIGFAEEHADPGVDCLKLALDIFNHAGNKGGWMYGDVRGYITRKMNKA